MAAGASGAQVKGRKGVNKRARNEEWVEAHKITNVFSKAELEMFRKLNASLASKKLCVQVRNVRAKHGQTH